MHTPATQPQDPILIAPPPSPDEHLNVLADAVRDDSADYDDPPLAAA